MVLGEWIESATVKCAEIVPASFDGTAVAHLLGSSDTALLSPRNALSLHYKIREAFDNGAIVVVPDGSVEQTPTAWKMVLLDESMRNQPAIHRNYHSKEIVTWDDLDGRKLRFRNDHRPARRYLYFRYVMSCLTAREVKWPELETKMPAGQIWTSPNKPDGYLRKSVLGSLARGVEDDYDGPVVENLLAGSFDDTMPATGNADTDKLATVALTLLL